MLLHRDSEVMCGSIHPSSVKAVFSEHIRQFNAKFGGKVPLYPLSKKFVAVVFQNFTFFMILFFRVR